MNSAHAMWYLTRSTGIVTLVLVTLSVLIGIISSLRAGGKRTPRFVVAGLHRNVSLLTVVFIAIHVTTTVLDGYAPITFLDSVVPFISSYRPIWLGLGAVASDLVLALVITSLIRVRIGLRTWRGIHWTAYACFPIAIVHSLGTGSDASRSWMLAVVIGSVALVAIATLVRLWQGRQVVQSIRFAGTAAVVVLPIIALIWATNGPLAKGWASRAGTPTHSGGASSNQTTASNGLPSPPYTAPITGTINGTAADAAGNTTITLQGTAQGSSTTVLNFTITGPSNGSGGVTNLSSSTAQYGPPSQPALYSGTVIGLQNSSINISVSNVGAAPQHLLIAATLRINFSAGTFSGQIQVN